MNPDGLLTTAQVAELFAVDVSTVSRWVQLDRIPTAGRFGTTRTAPIMFSAADVTAWGAELVALAAERAA